MRLKYTILFLLTIFFTSCGVINRLPKTNTTYLNRFSEGPISYKEQFKFKYLFLEAQRNKAIEEYEKAYNNIEQCLSIDPSSADAHFEMADLCIKINLHNEAIFHCLQSKKFNPDNPWVIHLLASVYHNQGDLEGESLCYEELIELEPHNIENKFQLAQIYTQTKNYKKALKLYNDIEKQMGINEEVTICKERLFILMGNIDLAALELKNLIASFPHETRYLAMLAELYRANDLNILALKTLEKILTLDKKNTFANMAMAEYYRLKNDFNGAVKYLQVCFENPEFEVESMLQILSLYLDLSFKEDKYSLPLESLLKKALSKHKEHGRLNLLAGDLAFKKNKSLEAFNSYEKAIDQGVIDFSILNRYLMLGLELKKYPSVCEKGLKAIELYPIQPTLYLITGISFSLNNQHLKAIELLKGGLSYVVNNPLLKADIYSYLGNSYHELKNYEDSDKFYQKSIELVPENPVVLNNYGYFLSLRSVNLKQAKLYSKKSIDLNPDEPNYYDTYGWILYKLNLFEEAIEWLEKAVLHLPENSIVLEHYGDVLFRLGRKDEAVSYWKKAKEIGGGSKYLNQKTREGFLYE